MNTVYSVFTGLNYALIGLLAHIVLMIAMSVRIINVQRNTGMAIAWLVLMFAVPVAGIVGYVLIGEPTIGRRYRQRSHKARQLIDNFLDNDQHIGQHQAKPVPVDYQGLANMVKAHTSFGVSDGVDAQLLASTDEIFDRLIADIDQAQTTVFMAFYIIHPQGRVEQVLQRLKIASERGVQCHILADSVGSVGFFTHPLTKRLEQAGVVVHRSMPVGLFKTLVKRADVRNHRKLVAIDERVGYIGSFNLIDPRFFKQDKAVGQWVDAFLRLQVVDNQESTAQDGYDDNTITHIASVILTDIGAESQDNLLALDERINQHTRKLYQHRSTHVLDDIGTKGRLDNTQTNPSDASADFVMPRFAAVSEQGEALLQLVPSAPQITAYVIYNLLVSAIHRANHSVCITTPYFVPDQSLLDALTTSARRGVTVTLIVPKNVDSRLVKHASQSFFEPLLRSGVRIALFYGGLLHTKSVVIDTDFAIFGTVNMDMRSFYLNMEVSLAIYHQPLVEQIHQCQQHYLQQCDYVSLHDWQQRSGWRSFIDNGVRLISPLL